MKPKKNKYICDQCKQTLMLSDAEDKLSVKCSSTGKQGLLRRIHEE